MNVKKFKGLGHLCCSSIITMFFFFCADLERLEKHLDSKKTSQEEMQEPLLSNLQDLVQSFQGTADRLTTGVETNLEALMQKQLRDATDR